MDSIIEESLKSGTRNFVWKGVHEDKYKIYTTLLHFEKKLKCYEY
jgi:hypothetical protein